MVCRTLCQAVTGVFMLGRRYPHFLEKVRFARVITSPPVDGSSFTSPSSVEWNSPFSISRLQHLHHQLPPGACTGFNAATVCRLKIKYLMYILITCTSDPPLGPELPTTVLPLRSNFDEVLEIFIAFGRSVLFFCQHLHGYSRLFRPEIFFVLFCWKPGW